MTRARFYLFGLRKKGKKGRQRSGASDFSQYADRSGRKGGLEETKEKIRKNLRRHKGKGEKRCPAASLTHSI